MRPLSGPMWIPRSHPINEKPDKGTTAIFFSSLLLLLLFFFFSAVPMSYGSSQARGHIGTVAAGLHHSSWQYWILNPLNKVRYRTCVLIDTGQICFRQVTLGIPYCHVLKILSHMLVLVTITIIRFYTYSKYSFQSSYDLIFIHFKKLKFIFVNFFSFFFKLGIWRAFFWWRDENGRDETTINWNLY